MKLNNIFLLAGIAAACVFTSCSKDDEYSAGAQATGTQLMAVTFGEDNIASQEIEPEAVCTYHIPVYRDKQYSSEAATVPVKVVTNTNGVFEVPENVTFAAGDTVATLAVDFPKAEVGVSYSLEVALDDQYVHPYKSSTYKTYAYTVQRVKWNDLGEGVLYDDFWYGTAFEGINIQQRDDQPSCYRFINPETSEFTEEDAAYTKYIVLYLDDNDYVSWNGAFYFSTTYSGSGDNIGAWYPSDLGASSSYNEYSYAVRDEDGSINYFQIAPYWYINGLGGWSPKSGYNWYLYFPGKYVAPEEEPEEEVKARPAMF